MPDSTTIGSAVPPGLSGGTRRTALAPDDTSWIVIGIDRRQNPPPKREKKLTSFVSPMQELRLCGDSGHIGLMLPGVCR